MLALSWPAYSPMVVPALALVVAAGLDRLESSRPAVAYVIASLVCIVTWAHAAQKLITPFGWMFWQESPVGYAIHPSILPELAGLQLSQPTLACTEQVTSVIQEHSRPGDTLLVYPYFPIFYVLSHRNPPTYNFNHFLDVCPDEVCAQDASVLLQSPPEVIVYMVEDTPIMQALEQGYRGGKISGSRQVVRAIEQLTGSYRLLYTFATPGSGRRINVYARS